MTELLFLAQRAPSAPDRGDRIRSHHVLRHLAARARVHVVAFDEGDPPRPAIDLASWTIVRRTRSRARAVAQAIASGRPVSLTAFADSRLTAAVAKVGRVDRAYVFSGQMAQHVPAGQRFVMDFVDRDSAKFAQLAHGPAAWLMAREARLLAAEERRIAERAEASLFVSAEEAAGFGPRALVIGNGIDAVRFDPARAAPAMAGPLVVFTGQMDYPPNVEAVQWFARDVLPGLDARFAIVGRAPTAAVRALAAEEVVVTGAVEDVRGWLAAASVCVAPLKLARGVQNKILEAMAMARPIVATPCAAEGIDHDRAVVVADGAAAFADAVCKLLDAPAKAAALGEAARARILHRYGWSERLAPLVDLLHLANAA